MEVTILSLSYKPLWDMLTEKGINKMEFAKSVGISNATLAKLGKDEPISLTTVDKICNEYDCDIENVVKHISTIKVDDKSSPELNVGTIISTQYLLSRVLIHPMVDEKNYYAVTEKERDEQLFLFEDIKQYTYKIALLTSKPSKNNLYIPIPHLKLGDLEHTNLFLRLDTIRVLPNDLDFQIVGNLPHYVKDKIVRFNSFMKTL